MPGLVIQKEKYPLRFVWSPTFDLVSVRLCQTKHITSIVEHCNKNVRLLANIVACIRSPTNSHSAIACIDPLGKMHLIIRWHGCIHSIVMLCITKNVHDHCVYTILVYIITKDQVFERFLMLREIYKSSKES